MNEITLTMSVAPEVAAHIISLLAGNVPVKESTVAPPPAPIAPPAPTQPATEPLPTTSPQYTLEQVKRAGAELVQKNPDKGPMAVALLTKYGAKSISEIKSESLNAFALELKGLGATL